MKTSVTFYFVDGEQETFDFEESAEEVNGWIKQEIAKGNWLEINNGFVNLSNVIKIEVLDRKILQDVLDF